MKRFLILLLLLLIAVPLAAEPIDVLATPRAKQLQVKPLTNVTQLTTNRREKGFAVNARGKVRVVVELTTRPVIQQSSRSADAVRAEIALEQAALLDMVGISADYAYDTLFNGITIEISPAALDTLRNYPTVKAIYPDATYELQLDASLRQIKTSDAWLAAGGAQNAGRDMKIAIIDSGIEPLNPLFSGDGFTMPTGYPLGDCVTDYANFCNGKIIVARWYGENGGVPVGAIPQEIATPRDRQGHGSHVAGIAAGNFGDSGTIADAGDGVIEVISGVAPAAHLMIYKACWNGANCLGSGLLAALEDAVNDGADVINNSWGGGPGDNPLDNAFRTAIENAVAAGVPVVFSAGNEGNEATTITCPACVAETIAVASVHTNRIHGHHVQIVGDDIPPQFQNFSALPSADSPNAFPFSNAEIHVAQSVGSATACAPFNGTPFNGGIALTLRGDCSFADKVNNVHAAGATVLLVINNIGGPPVRFSTSGANQIPTLMLSQVDGLALRDWVLSRPADLVTIHALSRRTNDGWDDIIATTSSRGPNGDSTILKPDIAAPGVNILSAGSYLFSPTGFAFDSGTSMSAPHVTGGAALLLQLNPDWSPAQVKSALMSTANNATVLKEDGIRIADPFDIGAGRVDLAGAVGTKLTFAEPSYANPSCLAQCAWTNEVTNVSGSSWSGMIQGEGLTIATDTPVVTLDSDQSQSFAITVDTVGLAPNRWHFGNVNFVSRGQVTAHLPLAVYVVDGVESLVLGKWSSADPSRSAETPTPFYAGTPFTYTLRLTNPTSTTQTYILSDTLPTNIEYLPNSATNGLVYDNVDRRLSVVEALEPALRIVSADLGGYIDLLDQNPNLPPIACEGVCDDDFFAVEDQDFYYMGDHFDTIYLSANGFASFTPPPVGAATNEPQDMPDLAEPNHLVAPLWTDFDLEGTVTDDSGGGHIYAAEVTDGVTIWNVFEWRDVEHWGNAQPGSPSNVIHTFQLWIQRGTTFMWFTYDRLDEFGQWGYPVAIGAEDKTGLIGSMLYFNGDGGVPSPSIDTRVVNNGAKLYTFRAKVTGGLFADNAAVATDGRETYIARHRLRVGRDLFLPLIQR